MSRKGKYTKEELLKILEQQYNINNNIRQSDFCSKNGLPHYQTYIKEFGSWNNAKELINLPIKYRSDYKISPKTLIHKFKNLVYELEKIPSLSELEKIKSFPSHQLIYKHFNNYNNFIKSCGFDYNKIDNGKFKKEFLISEIQRFVNEFNKIPTPKDFEKLEGYPTRKTFTNHFGNFNNVVIEAGFEPAYIPVEKRREKDLKTYTKDFLINEIHRFINEFGHVPTVKEIDSNNDYPSINRYRKLFGNWNNALKEANLPLNSVSQYTDEFLESEFHRFVKENNRIPRYEEFNNSEYPSFWCYQHRFGSWNNAVIHYGYEPNDSNRKYILDDGEICASSYEFDISTWLKNSNIKYIRNVKYIDFIDRYKGKMDCDYVIPYNGTIWYVEMAGFLNERQKLSDAEIMYLRKLKYKIKLLKRQKLNYLIIYPSDIKSKSLMDIFYFLDVKKEVV